MESGKLDLTVEYAEDILTSLVKAELAMLWQTPIDNSSLGIIRQFQHTLTTYIQDSYEESSRSNADEIILIAYNGNPPEHIRKELGRAENHFDKLIKTPVQIVDRPPIRHRARVKYEANPPEHLDDLIRNPKPGFIQRLFNRKGY